MLNIIIVIPKNTKEYVDAIFLSPPDKYGNITIANVLTFPPLLEELKNTD